MTTWQIDYSAKFSIWFFNGRIVSWRRLLIIWNGLFLRILTLLDFYLKWIHWIQQCLSTATFSILLDGSPYGKFFLYCGLRHGDLLSLIMGSEILSRLIFKEENREMIYGIKISRQSPRISHLLFAENLKIFSSAKNFEALSNLSCLERYSNWSG